MATLKFNENVLKSSMQKIYTSQDNLKHVDSKSVMLDFVQSVCYTTGITFTKLDSVFSCFSEIEYKVEAAVIAFNFP